MDIWGSTSTLGPTSCFWPTSSLGKCLILWQNSMANLASNHRVYSITAPLPRCRSKTRSRLKVSLKLEMGLERSVGDRISLPAWKQQWENKAHKSKGSLPSLERWQLYEQLLAPTATTSETRTPCGIHYHCSWVWSTSWCTSPYLLQRCTPPSEHLPTSATAAAKYGVADFSVCYD